MAFLSNELCHVHKKETPHVNGECSLCEKEKAEKELKAWEARPLKEKLRDLHLRVKSLEKYL